MTAAERFDQLLTLPNSDGCRFFLGPLFLGKPYGQFHPVKGKTVRAHRFAWEQKHGPIPRGLQVDHWRMNEVLLPGETYRCSRLCVEHLRVVTCHENLHASPLRRAAWADTGRRERERRSKIATCVRGHVFTSVRPNGRRRCHTCENDARRGRR